MKFAFRALAVLCALCAVAAPKPAQADIQIDVNSPTIFDLGGGLYRWDYDVKVALNERIESANFFTIYDFSGFQSGSQNTVGGWTPSASLTGGDVVGAAPFADNGSLMNLTWTYSGPTIAPGTFLGTFSAVSNRNTMKLGEYAGEGTINSANPLTDGLKDPNLGTTPVPTSAPEPTSIALLGLGGLGMLQKLRRRQNT